MANILRDVACRGNLSHLPTSPLAQTGRGQASKHFVLSALRVLLLFPLAPVHPQHSALTFATRTRLIENNLKKTGTHEVKQSGRVAPPTSASSFSFVRRGLKYSQKLRSQSVA